jgi:SAM-dependent methyltransferase
LSEPGRPAEDPFRPEHFQRVDDTDDSNFYVEPRLTTHIDDAAIGAAREFYGQVLPREGHILDLMTSWASHLPEDNSYASVTGLGMNQVELEKNPQLTCWALHDLNADPALPYADGQFDGAVVTVSVQYLTSPIEVFADMGRVLKPGSPFVLTYSNRCFPTKAVAVWQGLSDAEHAKLIGLYFRLSGEFDDPQAYDLSPNHGSSDPLYAVMATAKSPSQMG